MGESTLNDQLEQVREAANETARYSKKVREDLRDLTRFMRETERRISQLQEALEGTTNGAHRE